MQYELLPAQKDFILIPHNYPRDIALYQGGYGCVDGETELETLFGKTKIKDFEGGFIWSYFNKHKVLLFATKPKQYNKKKLYEVKTKNGNRIICTKEHKFLTDRGFKSLYELSASAKHPFYIHSVPFFQSPQHSNSGLCRSKFFSNVLNLMKKFQDFLLHCLNGCRLYDVLSHSVEDIDQGVPPSQAGAHEHNRENLRTGGQGFLAKHNRFYRFVCHLSKSRFSHPLDRPVSNKEYCAYENTSELPLVFFLQSLLFLLMISLVQLVLLFVQELYNLFEISLNEPPSKDYIESITYIREDLYYDIHIPFTNCYISQGFINHNSGKTFCGSLLGILLALKYDGITGLVGALTYPLVRDTTLKTYFEHLDNMGFKQGYHYEFKTSESKIIFKNGSEILFRHMEEPNKLKSLNLGFIELEEMSDIPESTFKMLLGRLRQTIKPEWKKKDFRYRLFGHTNPESTKGWIYKYFVEEKQDNYRLIQAPTTQNKFLAPDFVESLKNAYDEQYYKINVLGEFGDYTSGLVVKGFTSDNIHSITYQPDMPLHLTWDFNVDPMSCILAHKTENKVFYFDEFILENASTEQTIGEVIKRYPNHKGTIIINGDASGDNRSTQSERTNYVIIKNALRRHYPYNPILLHLRPFNPRIKNRIASFNAMVKDYNGIRKIIIDPKCEKLIYNCRNLKYKVGSDEVDVPTYSAIKTDNSLKFLEHPFDAASYLVEYYFPLKIEDYNNKPVF